MVARVNRLEDPSHRRQVQVEHAAACHQRAGRLGRRQQLPCGGRRGHRATAADQRWIHTKLLHQRDSLVKDMDMSGRIGGSRKRQRQQREHKPKPVGTSRETRWKGLGLGLRLRLRLGLARFFDRPL